MQQKRFLTKNNRSRWCSENNTCDLDVPRSILINEDDDANLKT